MVAPCFALLGEEPGESDREAVPLHGVLAVQHGEPAGSEGGVSAGGVSAGGERLYA